MDIGIPKEIKKDEYRVSMVPAGVETLVSHGHRVFVEKNAGEGSGISNKDYESAGAIIVENAEQVYSKAELIVKVKEPQPQEYELLREGQVVFTYLHLAASKELTTSLLKQKIVAIAYETIQTADGSLPLLTPMSEIAGRLAVLEGAKCLERTQGGEGILLSGVAGVTPAEVVILGGGIVGKNAGKMAAGLGAEVTILDINIERLRQLEDIMPANVRLLFSDKYSIREMVKKADLLIGAVLVPGARAPILVTAEMIKTMKKGAVIVDVSVDQGGCVETTRPTTHSEPTYIVDGVVHYCVANMPAAVARTSTYALANASLPYVIALADKGYKKAVKEDPALAKGVNMIMGKLTLREVADLFDLEYCPLEKILD